MPTGVSREKYKENNTNGIKKKLSLTIFFFFFLTLLLSTPSPYTNGAWRVHLRGFGFGLMHAMNPVDVGLIQMHCHKITAS